MALAQPNTQQSALMHRAAALTPSPTQTPAHLVHIKSPEDDDGLDALISGHAAQRHEMRKEVKLKRKSNIYKAIGEYKYLLKWLENDFNSEDMNETLRYDIDKGTKAVLTPNEIYAFSQAISVMEYSEVDRIGEERTSNTPRRFIEQLIQNSYNAGHNNFRLDLSEMGIHTLCLMKYLGEGLHGKKEMLLQLHLSGVNWVRYCVNDVKYCFITIDGDVSSRCGNSAKYSTFIINGYVDSCGGGAEYSSFTINGDTNSEFGYGVENCCLTINGNVKHNAMSYAKRSTFIINGELENEYDSLYGNVECVFKTTSKITLNKFLKTVLRKGDNKVYFIQPDGTEELMRTN